MKRSALSDLSNRSCSGIAADGVEKSVFTSAQGSASVDELLSLSNDLSSYGNDYALSSALNMFLERLESCKKAAIPTETDFNMESAAQSRFLDSMDVFKTESEEYEQAFKELENAKKLNKEQETITSLCPLTIERDLEGDLEGEIRQSEMTLIKLQEKESKIDEYLAAKQMKFQQAQVALELSTADATKIHTDPTQLGKFAMKNSIEEKEFSIAMKKVLDQRDHAEALLEGLRVLTGVQSISVPQEMVQKRGANRLSSSNFNASKSVKDEHVLPMTVEIGNLTAILMLDDQIRLTNIEVINGDIEIDESSRRDKRRSVIALNSTTSDVLNEILEDAQSFSSPQDIRHAIFTLGAIQKSPVIMKAHVSDLRKKCIVRSTGPLSAEFTLSVGVTVSLVAHKCYPNIPAGIKIDSIIGVGGWNKDEIETIKNKANMLGVSTIMDMFEYLQSAEAFGQ
jgi:hypothetical protein